MNGLSIVDLQEMMSQGAFSSKELCQETLQRIAGLNEKGPALRAIIEENPEALYIAEKLDKEREKTGPRSLLHGIPIVLKDNIDTADLMQTAAGSLALAGKPALKDAYIVKRLRDAGAVVIAKANLSEWANFRSTKSSSGWSSRGGQCRNPYDLTRSPCGSSSGSAVSVAAGIVPLAVGTETDGSIICPASMNSIVGIKPTMGRVSRSGIIPIAFSQDTAGPMAVNVADAAILLDVLSGYDQLDSMTERFLEFLRGGKSKYETLTHDLRADGLQGKKIGIPRHLCGFDQRVDHVFEEHVRVMEKAGAVLVDNCIIPEVDSYASAELTVLLYEFKHYLNSYLKERGDTVNIRSLEELISYNRINSEKVMPFFGQELFLQSQEKGSLQEAEYRSALQTCQLKADEQGLRIVFEKHNLDALVMPSNGPAWKIDHVNGDRYTGGKSGPAAVSGYPSITIPAGYVEGLPVGTTFLGKPFTEGKLIACAYALEQIYPVREEPELA
ncbi:MAG: amidase [Spirochaetes bacterium]|nr:amidase [Spirochaetota bacterium]